MPVSSLVSLPTPFSLSGMQLGLFNTTPKEEHMYIIYVYMLIIIIIIEGIIGLWVHWLCLFVDTYLPLLISNLMGYASVLLPLPRRVLFFFFFLETVHKTGLINTTYVGVVYIYTLYICICYCWNKEQSLQLFFFFLPFLIWSTCVARVSVGEEIQLVRCSRGFTTLFFLEETQTHAYL